MKIFLAKWSSARNFYIRATSFEEGVKLIAKKERWGTSRFEELPPKLAVTGSRLK
jgi:hypothetical protein